MAKNIEPNLKLISEYLKLKKTENFIIPEYQRGYSWDVTQCDKLWQDIESFISSNASDPYFFGTIIVDCSSTDKFSLIDGQQRTTTFLLLLKALLIRLNEAIPKVPEDEESEELKAGLKAKRNKIMSILYKAEDEDIPAMLRDSSKTKNILILENKSINELFLDEIKKIIEAVDYRTCENSVFKIPKKQKDNKYTNHFRNFKFFFGKLGEKTESQLNQFAKIFLQNCQVIEIRSWQIEQAITMFNSLNSTGMPLSDADIISAQLYSNAETDKMQFNELWENINRLANDLSTRKIIDIVGVLQQFMYINRAVKKEYLSIKDDGNESIDVTTPGLRRYYTNLNKDLLSEPIDLCRKLLKITNIWNEIKDFPCVKLLLKFNENAKLFLSGYLNRYELNEISENLLTDVCESLIRLFAVLELSDFGYSSSKFKTFLFSVNLKLVDNNVSVDSIKNDFIEHIGINWSQESIMDSIVEYERNILVFLNEYIYSKNKGITFDFSDNVNVEHIMPASGRNVSIIQHDAGIIDKDEFKGLVNKLGNKILLEEDINKSISNEWFKTKKQSSIINKTGYKDSKYGIAQSLTTYPRDNWTKEDIELSTKKSALRIVNFIFNN
jgi:uncharacterized protein with ParB-like and HNH nuclease domain